MERADGWTIGVGVMQVPDSGEVRIDPDSGRLNRSSAPTVLSAPDRDALEAALSIRSAGRALLHYASLTTTKPGRGARKP